MGFFGELWEGVRDVASKLWEGAKVVVSTIAKVGPRVLAVAKPLVKALCVIAPQLRVPLEIVLKSAETVVQLACVACGLIAPEESVSELGERALEAGEQGIHPEDFEDPEEYLNAVRRTPLAKNRDKWTDEERSLSGISTLAYCLQVKFSISPEIYPLFVRYSKFFTERRMEGYIKYAVKTGFDLSHLTDFFSSNSTVAEKGAALDFMKKAEEAINPGFDMESFVEELLKAKQERPEGTV